MFDRIDKGLYWDRSWRVVNGCTKVSPGCARCWSEAETNVRGSNPLVAERYAKAEVMTGGKWNGQVRLAPERVLSEPLRTKKPQVWAVWNDLFHEDVPDRWIADVFSTIFECDRHTFLILTKRPKRMKSFLGMRCFDVCNIGLGVTVEGPETRWRADVLDEIPSAFRFISFEPLIADPGTFDLTGFSWIIAGGETGPGARPMNPLWIRDLRDQCVTAGVPFFLKQWGEWGPTTCTSAPRHLQHHWSNASAPGEMMERVGKKAAGCLLDGKEWHEFPRN